MNKYWLVALVICIATAVSGTQVTRVAYREQSQGRALELGTLELYGVQQPVMSVKTISRAHGHELLELSAGPFEMKADLVAQLEAIKGAGFVVKANNAQSGRIITITYDPQIVSVIHEPIVSISMEHGVSIRFIDRQLLRTLEHYEKPVLSVAYLG